MDNERNAPYGSTSGASASGSGMGSSGMGATGMGASGLGTGGTAGVGGASGSAGVGGMGASAGIGGQQQPQQDQGIADKAKHLASQAQEQVTEKARDQFDSTKGRLASAVRDLATALRQANGSPQGGAQIQQLSGMGVQYLSTAGNQVERLADYIERTEPQEIVMSAERFARRQPALFLGGTFALGLLAARFLKSSSRNEQADYSAYGQRDYARGSYGAYGSTGAYAGASRNSMYDQERSLAGYREPTSSGLGASAGTSGTTGSAYGAGYGSTAGTSGAAGLSGTTGSTGSTGATGTSGLSGSAGTSGAGLSGSAGTSGTAGAAGTSGLSGSASTSRPGGLSPMGGSAGTSGSTGASTSGATGGTTGTTGATGTPSSAGSQKMGNAGSTGSGTSASTPKLDP